MTVFNKSIILVLFCSEIANSAVPAAQPSPQPSPNDMMEATQYFQQSTQVKTRKNLKLDIGCKREFSHDGQYYRLDSYDAKDGERLRPFISEYPEAINQLNLYQKNSSSLTTAATIGTIGLIAMILANNLLNSSRVGQTTQDVARYGGIGLLGGAAIFSLITLRTNESHLTEAVQIHNQNNGANPIELKFNTGFVF